MSQPTFKNPSVKFVKKAGMWCKTYFEDGKQKQEWTMDKPQAEIGIQ